MIGVGVIKMILEVCVENFIDVEKMVELGAKRIELCDNLSVGGTTVSYGVAKQTISYCKERNVEVMCIVRPRGGDFVYSEDEVMIMLEDITVLKELGATGIVIGCLQSDGWIDEIAIKRCVEVATGIDVTFHMAFDEIPKHLKMKAIDTISQLGISRILTHGGVTGTNVIDNLPSLIEYDKYAKNRLTIMPGGGVTADNREEMLSIYPFRELHGTKILRSE